MFSRILDSELIRYKKHEWFWAVAFGAVCATTYKMWMDLLIEQRNIKS